MTEPKSEKPQPSTGSSSGPVYQVQVRVRDRWPAFHVGDTIVDQEWRDIRLAPSVWPVGVPTPRYAMDNIDHGVPFQVAEAQRWIFISLVEASCRGSVETRIIERKVTRSWTCEEVGEVKAMPRWEQEHNIWNEAPLKADE